jgi:hypothetical protein
MTVDVQLKRCRIVERKGFTIDHTTQLSLPNFSDFQSILKPEGYEISEFDITPFE